MTASDDAGIVALATKSFDMEDQRTFARVSGDVNPIHMDPVAARRMPGGAPVVHGMHVVLWALDRFLQSEPEFGPVVNIRAQFNAPVIVGERVELVVRRRRTSGVSCGVSANGAALARLEFSLAPGHAAGNPMAAADEAALEPRAAPIEVPRGALATRAGRVAFVPTAAASHFAHAAGRLGAGRVAALAGLSRLVGMVCPGLHSLLGALDVDLVATDDGRAAIAYQVVAFDERFHKLTEHVAGGGVCGRVEAFVRPAPVQQPALATLMGRVAPGEFGGSVALVIGGSRGLGALTAKIVAAGGGDVILSYALGADDARSIQEEIRRAGRACTVLRYDALQDPRPQLAALDGVPNRVYYFATPQIAGPAQRDLFDDGVFARFCTYFVSGFYHLCRAVAARAEGGRVFYPSTVFLAGGGGAATVRGGLTEYCMAKSAGEQLCRDLGARLPRLDIIVSRLPRVATDQTASVAPTMMASAVDVMVPIVRAVQAQMSRTGQQPPR